MTSNQIKYVKLSLASPEKILKWSHGEVLKPETINYKSQKCEKDGLFCEKIFGPTKDWECSCGKFKRVRHKGTKCDRCGVEIISSKSRRERMGHINLVSPVFHIWYLNEFITKILSMKLNEVKEVVYFVSHIVLDPGTCERFAKKQVLRENVFKNNDDVRSIFQEVFKDVIEDEKIIDEDKNAAKEFLQILEDKDEAFEFQVYSSFISRIYGVKFGIGAEAIYELLSEIDLAKDIRELKKKIKKEKSLFQGANTKKKNIINKLNTLIGFEKSKLDPKWMVIQNLPVLPPNLRPMIELDGGRFSTSDVNDLYRRIIIRNNRLRKLQSINAPKVILYNEKRMLQQAVDALIDNGASSKKVLSKGQGNRALKSLTDNLKGKQGRFRQNLLGKRVDYSGRSVIAVGPELKIYECGLPRIMAATLFKPFIIERLVAEDKAANIKSADKLVENNNSVIWPILEDIIATRPVLLNRAPTLHRLGIQAFMPKLIKGKAIRLHPLVTPAFNADFDGDQMAVHIPLSKEAIAESQILMIGSSNILSPKDGNPIVTPSQDMVLGNYYITIEKLKLKGQGLIFGGYNEIIQALENKKVQLHSIIVLATDAMPQKDFGGHKYLITTPGKVIFNKIFPEDFPFIHSELDLEINQDIEKSYYVKNAQDIKEKLAKYKVCTPFKKSTLSKIISLLFQRYSLALTSQILDKIKDIGFKYSTISGTTISIGDINTTSHKYDFFKKADQTVDKIEQVYKDGLLTNNERYERIIDLWSKVKDQVQDEIYKDFNSNKDNPIFLMSDSGARGNISNFTQLVGMRGLMVSPQGTIIEIPIKSSFIEGLSGFEFFISTHGARKGIADIAQKTAKSGYLTRILVDAAQDIIVKEYDCGVENGLIVKSINDTKTGTTIVPMEKRLEGRILNEDIVDASGQIIVEKGKMITIEDVEKIKKLQIKEIEVRSCVTCETHRGVCQLCYGKNLANGELVDIGEAVGVIAAQSMGEPGTQLTMRTFHTGGVAGQTDITQGLPRILQLLEVRWNLPNRAKIAEFDGVIKEINEIAPSNFDVVLQGNNETKTYKNITSTLRVKKGSKVKIGDKISDGPICPRELLRVADSTLVARYIIKEVQRVFSLQGIDISDKHIEIFAKKMLRKVMILHEGDTDLQQGKEYDKYEVVKANKKVFGKGKKPAVVISIIEGIQKASEENESFISTSSFQTTTKKLREAAVEGKMDILNGIKENVVVGNLIPAGTGVKAFQEKVAKKYEKMMKQSRGK